MGYLVAGYWFSAVQRGPGAVTNSENRKQFFHSHVVSDILPDAFKSGQNGWCLFHYNCVIVSSWDLCVRIEERNCCDT